MKSTLFVDEKKLNATEPLKILNHGVRFGEPLPAPGQSGLAILFDKMTQACQPPQDARDGCDGCEGGG